MSTNKQALLDSAESTIGILENIAGFEPSDIDGDAVELRFETEGGFDTGCDVSIVDQCQKAADVIRALLDELAAKDAELQEYRNASSEPIGAPDAWLWKKKTGYITAGISRPMYDPLHSAAIPLYAAPQPLTDAERAELQEYRNAQQVVPSKPTESDIPSWLNGEKRLHWLSGAEWMHNTFCAAMQSGAVKDGMAALELARGMANDPIAGAMSLVPADRKQDLI